LLFVLPWVFGSVLIGLGIGFHLGTSRSGTQDQQRLESEREATLKMLNELLEVTEQMSDDVREHNTQLRQLAREVVNLPADEKLQSLQQRLMAHVTQGLQANMRLEDDMTVARSHVAEHVETIDGDRRESRTDALSGVGNRQALDERLEASLARCRRQGVPFSLLMVDVDWFQRINDTYGHAAGDVLIAHLGEFLRKCVRSRDFVARYDDDQFVLLLAKAELSSAARAAERLRKQTCRQTFDLGTGAEEIGVTFSVGVAGSWPEATADELLDRAEKAMRQSKTGGRNIAFCYDNGEAVPANRYLPVPEEDTASAPEQPAQPAPAPPEIAAPAVAAPALEGTS
jgi:diguanylate cyclase